MAIKNILLHFKLFTIIIVYVFKSNIQMSIYFNVFCKLIIQKQHSHLMLDFISTECVFCFFFKHRFITMVIYSQIKLQQHKNLRIQILYDIFKQTRKEKLTCTVFLRPLPPSGSLDSAVCIDFCSTSKMVRLNLFKYL